MIRVVGTAGHVDHGKSALVEALTGTHPDRLREERERQMTIDLGFAWTSLADGLEIGLIDVPGHRDFIDNMLAGVGGFDAALLVVAVDEGLMPQTREHLAILDLLEIPAGVVALTKIDLVEEAEWADLVEEELRRTIGGTVLDGAPILRVSARTGAGLEELRAALAAVVAGAPPRRDLEQPRLPIDRAFVMTGFGTVVTGTLLDGALAQGEEVVLQPSGVRGRIRGLQTHRKSVALAAPGSRVAVNLSGIDVRQVSRGDVLTREGVLKPTRRLDARVRVLSDAAVGIDHAMELKFHVGAADVVARARTLGQDRIEAGQEGWLQLVFPTPVAVAEGDRFILRRPAPPATVGGGRVVDANPARLHRRRDLTVIEALRTRAEGSAADRILHELTRHGPLTVAEVEGRLPSDGPRIAEALEELLTRGRTLRLKEADGSTGDLYVEAESWRALTDRILATLNDFHDANPLRLGMPREELRSRLAVDGRIMDRLMTGLAGDGRVGQQGARVWRAGFSPSLEPGQRKVVEALAARFRAAPHAPPSLREAREAVGDEVWAFLVAQGAYVEVGPDVAFDGDTYRRLVAETAEALQRGDPITVATVRDRYRTTRKYALAFLEHLDQVGMTLRVGDERKLRPGWAPSQPGGPPAG